MSISICRLCFSNETEIHRCKEFMFNTLAEFDYIECRMCGSVSIKEIPENMTPYYSNNYYSMHQLTPEITERKRFKKLTYKLKKELAAKEVDKTFEYKVLASMKPKLEDKICDVGCGSGHLIYHMKNLGYKNIIGNDPFLEADIVYPNGLVIQKKKLSEVHEKFDLIMFNHSLEHVENPGKYLRLAKERLNPKGKILVRIPIIGYNWHVYKQYWFGLDAPRHFHLFSVKGLSIVAKQQGLKIQEINYDSCLAGIVNSEIYKRRDQGIPEITYPWWSKRFFKKWNNFKNQILVNEFNKQGFSDQAGFILTQ